MNTLIFIPRVCVFIKKIVAGPEDETLNVLVKRAKHLGSTSRKTGKPG